MSIDIDEILKDYIDVVPEDRYEISERVKGSYKNYNFPIEILIEIDVNTKLREYIKSNPKFEADATELEDFRVFDRGFFREKGIFYCEGIHFANEFKPLMESTFRFITNGAFDGRYCLPICLPNGDVFTWMTYDPNAQYKYMVPKAIERKDLDFFHQGNLLGNLESITKYPYSTEMYFAEGLFDAYRLEEQFKAPGIALLGSNLSRHKFNILKTLKERTGKRFVYVPDFDETGLVSKLIESDIWDTIFNYAREFDTDAKDIDKYFRDRKEEYEKERQKANMDMDLTWK